MGGQRTEEGRGEEEGGCGTKTKPGVFPSRAGTPFPPLGGGDKQTRISMCVQEPARRIPAEPAWAVRPTCDV